jgi:hypothetical protein
MKISTHMSFLSTLFGLGILVFSSAHAVEPNEQKLIQAKDKKAIEAVIQKNLESINFENIEEMANTLDSSCASYQPTINLMTQIFIDFDLEMIGTKIEILEQTATTAKVRCVTEARKLKGDKPFSNNRTTYINTLNQSKGKWRICNSEMEQVEGLVKAIDPVKQVIDPMQSKAIIQVLQKNTVAFQSENIEQLMSTISPKCEAYKTTKSMMTNVFQNYDLKIQVIDRKILSISGNKAIVQERVQVKKLKGTAPFNDNETLSQSNLVNDGTGWFICDTSILNITYLK